MNLSVYTGRKVDEVKSELEKLGFSVVLVENANNIKQNSISLVVRAKLVDNNVIELVCSSFVFLR